MFDPTAYENIKVVLEGIVYENDLQGEILVIERNDLVNLADLSRSFNITFTHKDDIQHKVQVKIGLLSTFKQIASEWMTIHEQPGAGFSITFVINEALNEVLVKRMNKYMKQRTIGLFDVQWKKVIYSDQTINYEFLLQKNTILTENIMDEIPSIITLAIDILVSIDDMI
ncbi:hypothetical protein OEV98_08730 [Caldibacillus lycopersici]|uniref:Group-specific protein n=1 Tax=Perspicuibacillus lycopersici TaxID=1325689 RepID=A0AAE3LQL6_9BACI|nr:hypothetical protein [Perspicuibacillus lycopersici]MCU9613644.1 hypothetical protein [Perspicuibacillus lycopersici]